MKLNKFTSISTGLISSRKEEDSGQEYKIINLNSVVKERIDKRAIDTIQSSDDLSNYMVKTGDVILQLTSPFKALYIDELLSGYLVSHHFCKITINNEKVLPRYLVWYINSKRGRSFIYRMSTSNMVYRLPISTLADLNVKVIPEEKQRNIAIIQELINRKIELMEAIIDNSEKLLKAYTENIYQTKMEE